MSTSPDGTAGWKVRDPSNASLISSIPVPVSLRKRLANIY
jgi:hypothetical protein